MIWMLLRGGGRGAGSAIYGFAAVWEFVEE